MSEERNNEFNLKGVNLDLNHSETLEEILKRIQFNKIDLEATSLNDEVFTNSLSFFLSFISDYPIKTYCILLILNFHYRVL